MAKQSSATADSKSKKRAEQQALDPLHAISPLDGRYRNKTARLTDYMSEFALMRYRVRVEVEYYILLSETGLKVLPEFAPDMKARMRALYTEFELSDAHRIKSIESIINHDVKAVEYYIKEHLRDDLQVSEEQAEFVHFGLTSQDVNNTAIPMLLRDALDMVYLPLLDELLRELEYKATQWRDIPMLAHTHGQPASPTTVGKEMYVFVERLWRQRDHLVQLKFPCKFGGATGNLNAHKVAFPAVNWEKFADKFVEERLGKRLRRSKATTQIEHYDDLAAIFDNLRRLNVILIDFSRDMWTYISLGYFSQKVNSKEVGSSAMPHKVNPIDFENAEGNLGIANAIFDHLSNKLPVSRLQRDLTDSTVLRNVGVPLGHSLVALQSVLKGLGKIDLNRGRLHQDLEANWAVVAEALQTILRREGYPQPYETLKALTRTGEVISQETIREFIQGLNLPEEVKAEMRAVTPHNYTGYSI
jgi:adenylosuccinate lyase